MKAYCLIREQPWYRRDAFMSGLKRAGLAPELRRPASVDRDTVLVIWNRYADNHELALQVERAGGRVWVAENGYVGIGGSNPKFDVHPHGPKPEHYYALAEGYHNGGGRIPTGDGSRWAALGVELKAWRASGEYVLVCPNRSFGVPARTMHPDWAEREAARGRKATGLPFRVRPHPGNHAPARPLAEDLKGAAAVIVWSSSCGVHALIEGIPTWCAAPAWILKEAACSGPLQQPTLAPRLPAFERLAWAQWRCDEIASGAPFEALLRAA